MWGLGEMLKTPHRKNISFCETFTQPQTWTDSLVQPKQRKRDMRIGTWNVRSLYRVGSFTAAARELARYKLDLVGVQKVTWDKGGTVRAEDYNFLCGKGNKNHQLGTGFIAQHRTVSPVTRAEFVSDRVSYTVLRDCWCNIIVPNVHRNRMFEEL